MNHKFATELLKVRQTIKESRPLIHCITNPISINDCANMVLAAGSRPIMAEHPEEVAEITAIAQTLCLNLGSITRDRLAAMEISAATAKEHNISMVVDLVGAACSSLREKFLADFIPKYGPAVIKGNITEILNTCGIDCHSSGVEANSEQLITRENAAEMAELLGKWAKAHETVLLVSGPRDFITDGEESYLLSNGVPMLGNITGTGCMLNALTASYLPAGSPLKAALLAALVLGIAGEKAAGKSQGPGTFHVNLFDEVFNLLDGDIIARAKIAKL
ncbi:Hydroxyethylthiazole kinase [Anaerovibrio sp. JC8]|nr:Hydroxyethylthiazole kinase [Anaerovibrio sp. JC8]